MKTVWPDRLKTWPKTEMVTNETKTQNNYNCPLQCRVIVGGHRWDLLLGFLRLLTISRVEENYGFVKKQFNLFMLSFVGLLLLLLGIDYFLVDRFFLKRIEKLIAFTKEVGLKRDTSLAIEMDGSDELKTLAVSTNQMLKEIDQANQNVKMMDERYRLMMEATNDGYLDIWVKKQEAYISPEWRQLIGYRGDDGHQLFEDYFSKIHCDGKKRLEQRFADIFSGRVDYFEEEYRVISELHGIIWVYHRGKVVQRDQNNQPLRFISTISDITTRKINEEEVLFLSYSDPLTRLKNRDFMKLQFESLKYQQDNHYFMIMCDVNGLKLTNDAFGHQEGDQVVIAVSKVLRRSCRPTDIIARWPGDEFVILLKDINQDQVCQLIREITEEIAKIRDFHLNVSVAIGYAESSDALKSPEEVLNLAESRMYRNKLMASSSSRNATIRSLAWTSVCTDQMRSLDRNADRFAGKNTVVLGFSVDPQPSKSVWARALCLKQLKILSDFNPLGAVAQAYGIFSDEHGASKRANILINETGMVIWVKKYEIRTLPDVEEVLGKI